MSLLTSTVPPLLHLQDFTSHIGQANVANFATPREGGAPPYRFLFHAQAAGSGSHVLVQVRGGHTGSLGIWGALPVPTRADPLSACRPWPVRHACRPARPLASQLPPALPPRNTGHCQQIAARGCGGGQVR